MKKILLFLFSVMLLSACSAPTAEELDKGISVEIAASQNLKHLTLHMYVNGRETFSENVINANNSAFEKGEIVWFDVSTNHPNSTVELALSYSKNLDATNAKTTERIDVSNASKWVNTKLNADKQLKLLDSK